MTVTNNIFDLTGETNQFYGVYVGPGGNFPNPYNVAISHNIFKLRTNAVALYNPGIATVTFTNNTVQ